MHASTKIIVVTDGLTTELLPGDDAFISQPYNLFFFLTTYMVKIVFLTTYNMVHSEIYVNQESRRHLCWFSHYVFSNQHFVNLLIFTYVTFGIYVASSPLRHATTSLQDWSFPALTIPTLFFLACARLTLLGYNACRTRLRGWSCLADETSPPLTCSGSYTGSLSNTESFTNSCCIFTKL